MMICALLFLFIVSKTNWLDLEKPPSGSINGQTYCSAAAYKMQ